MDLWYWLWELCRSSTYLPSGVLLSPSLVLGPTGLPPSETLYVFSTSSPFISKSFLSPFSTSTLSAMAELGKGGSVAERACKEKTARVKNARTACFVVFTGHILRPLRYHGKELDQ